MRRAGRRRRGRRRACRGAPSPRAAARTSTPHAPAASACAANAPPSRCSPTRPTKRSPSPTVRESIVTREGPGFPSRTGTAASSRAPMASAIQAASRVCISVSAPSRAAPHGRRSRRRREAFGRPRTPGPARGPCRRSRRRRPAPHARRRTRSQRARSSIVSTFAASRSGTPARTSAMIAEGSSERGLSEVTIAMSARRAPISPIPGRFPRSRSPPAPKTTITRSRVTPRAACSTFSSESGVCA